MLKILIRSIKLDKVNNSTKSFVVLFFYRINNFLYKKNSILILKIFLILENIIFSVLGITAQISYKSVIGDNIRLPHGAMGVVISSKAIIEDNQTIFHGVTIGINEKRVHDQRIIIKKNCYLSTGCKIISCIIEENCVIGPNAVVHKNIKAGTRVYNECIYVVGKKD